jgi:hypothetical protein
MSRPPRQPSRDEVDPTELEAYDQVILRASDPDRGGFVAAQQVGATAVKPATEDAGYYGRLLLAPALAHHLSAMGRLVRRAGDYPGSYTHAEREIVDQVLSHDLATNVIQPHHIPDAVAAGVRPEAIEAFHTGAEDVLTDEERDLAEYIRAVIDGEVTDELWAELEARKGERWMVEYGIFILYLQMTMRLQQLVGMPDPSDAEMEQLLADLRTGNRPVPEFVNRAG